MAWVPTIKRNTAEGALLAALQAMQALYPPEYATPVAGLSESIVESHTLFPEVLRHAFSAFGALMSPDLPLSRREHEMIATMVSATNGCFY
jgi:alkylhydroperoxidase family enzyme